MSEFYKINSITYEFDSLPDECPYCHHAIHPEIEHGRPVQKEEGDYMHLLLSCPRKVCMQSFIAYFERISEKGFDYLGYTSQGKILKKKFSKSIIEVSKSFTDIYNEANAAEHAKLFEICGVGYRKSLEFLIKDYSIKKYPNEKEKIEKKQLAQCISEYVNNDRIKSVVKRAVWLGNDETHYVKKWEGKSLIDLKKLIDLTLHWIEAEILTESLEVEMPE